LFIDAARARALALGNDPFESELAGVAEHHLTVIMLKVLIQPEARTGGGQD
jgi:hypothetical protein